MLLTLCKLLQLYVYMTKLLAVFLAQITINHIDLVANYLAYITL